VHEARRLLAQGQGDRRSLRHIGAPQRFARSRGRRRDRRQPVSLYDYLQGRLTQANLDNDESALREALELLGEIESAWNAIPDQHRQRSLAMARA
jgi:hypothetical protein